jgi:2,4-dienoyl-CoA reductase (NADPH2)
VFEVDNVIVAAGQEPKRDMETSLRKVGLEVHVIGGAKKASGLDAETAIKDGAELAVKF